MRTAQEIAASYNRMLLNIYYGEDSEYPTLEDYFDSLGYGLDYIVSSENWQSRNPTPTGVSILLAGGGPTVWLNTSDGMIYASDSSSVAGVGLFSEVRDEINNLYEVEY